MEMSAENSQPIITWLKHDPSDTYTKQEFVRGFEEDKVRLPSNDKRLPVRISFSFHESLFCSNVDMFPVIDAFPNGSSAHGN